MSNEQFEIKSLFNVKDWVCVVSGGGTGIGLMITQAFANNGARVYILGRREEVLKRTADKYGSSLLHPNGKIIPVQCDITSKESIEQMVQHIEWKETHRGGEGDESAEALRDELFSEKIEDWELVYRTNVIGHFTTVGLIPLLAKAAKSKPTHTGTVINISSLYLCDHLLAQELRHKAVNVRVNSIAPGIFPSEMTRGSDDANKSEIEWSGFGEKKGIPAGRPGRDVDMAQAILMLACNQYAYGQASAFHLENVMGVEVLPVTYSSTSHHVLYIRPHAGSSKNSKGQGRELPDGRTLFIVNVPPDATERELVLLFKSCGTIEKVLFDSNSGPASDEQEEESGEEGSDGELDEDDEMDSDASQDEHPRKKRKLAKEEPRAPKVKPLPFPPLRTLRKTGRTAHVIFLDPSSLSRALALSKPQKSSAAPQARPWPTSRESPLGLAHYAALYDALRPPLDAVRAHADTYIESFDFMLAQKKRALQAESKYRKGEAIVDEEGFTLVTRGGAYGQAVGGGVAVASKKFLAKSKSDAVAGGKRRRKKGETEKKGFYAFQVHEKKRKELMDLKRKWEEDKAKVEKLKASRKFKPY
ncbi:hypothetical protein EW146_g8168 [Bondarzewia mesenterica]|uniref:RRM domain-containing protein n=1 Tax=Bondarzewia mesenterica TaxID=1095465 RepID=A0A4S4LGM3_9AGAM|nr:hypothetical protein EW146_g8168 [Bondarzewia mesenterica]